MKNDLSPVETIRHFNFRRKVVEIVPMFNGTQMRIKFEGGGEIAVMINTRRGLIIPRRRKALYRSKGLIT